MITEYEGIRFISGTTDLFVVAPHGPFIDGRYENDARTGIIAEEIQRRLNCCALINDRFFKPKGPIKKSFENFFLDLFRIDHAGKVPGYLDRIRQIVGSEGRTLVVWLHGISDDVAVDMGKLHVDQDLFEKEPQALHALIGYGQGGDPKTGEMHDRPSASRETVEAFKDLLTSHGMTTLLTYDKGPNFRGRDAKRLNQWFNQLGYRLENVESIQLEIKESGFRNSIPNANTTARIIADSLALLLKRYQ